MDFKYPKIRSTLHQQVLVVFDSLDAIVDGQYPSAGSFAQLDFDDGEGYSFPS